MKYINIIYDILETGFDKSASQLFFVTADTWRLAMSLGYPPKSSKSSLLKLVGGLNPHEKYEFVNGKDDNPYMKWKIKLMFQTTKQIFVVIQNWLSTHLLLCPAYHAAPVGRASGRAANRDNWSLPRPKIIRRRHVSVKMCSCSFFCFFKFHFFSGAFWGQRQTLSYLDRFWEGSSMQNQHCKVLQINHFVVPWLMSTICCNEHVRV